MTGRNCISFSMGEFGSTVIQKSSIRQILNSFSVDFAVVNFAANSEVCQVLHRLQSGEGNEGVQEK